MRVKLQILKSGVVLYEGIHEIADADTFGRACASAWNEARHQQMANATSVGALFEELDEQRLEQLDGLEMRLSKA